MRQLQDGETETETYFYAGNTSYVGISKFLQEHICNDFCDMMISSIYLQLAVFIAKKEAN